MSRPRTRWEFITLSMVVLAALLVSGCLQEKEDPKSGHHAGTETSDGSANGMCGGYGDIDVSHLMGASLEDAFGVGESLHRMTQIREALNSFRQLTQTAQGKLTKEELEGVGNTDWAVQTLGFHNWPMTVEGTIRKQEYRIKGLELELAKVRYESGKITEEELKSNQMEYDRAKADLQEFIDNFSIAD